jgi:His-Xaa-Ser repeat protein HxsA
MKTVTTTLTLLISGMLASVGKTEASGQESAKDKSDKAFEPVSLRPLNLAGDNLFAAHRSHSSHRSHRSSSGGGYTSPAPAEPQKRQEGSLSEPGRSVAPPGSAQPTDPGRAAPVSPALATPRVPSLSRAEKLKLQVMRTQISLTTLGLYKGPISGELDDATKESLKHFQDLKGMQANGLMTTETLNALGIPAVE